MLPNTVKCIVFDTGNILTCKELKLRTSQTPTDEIIQSVKHILDKWLPTYKPDISPRVQDGGQSTSEDRNFNRPSTSVAPPSLPQTCRQLHIKSTLHETAINPEERQNLRITCKIFLRSYNEGLVPKAVAQALEHLKISYVDQVVVAFPTVDFTVQQQEPAWGELEGLVEQGVVRSIGASDLDLPHLRQLYQWAKIKPSVNQVNLESCCVMPLDMTAYAKENDIQLLTHSDPRVILPEDQAPKLLNGLVAEEETDQWHVDWIIRFAVTVKSRGILQSTGYFVSVVHE